MPSASQHHSQRTTKTLLIGDSSAGKTGSLASLVAAGYRVRMLDMDNGGDSVVALLNDPRYPYQPYCLAHGIDIGEGFNYVTITEEMTRHRTEGRFVPKAATAWIKMVDMIENWVDGDIRLGGIDTWTERDILVIDTLGKASWFAYYYAQQLNGRLGARMEGYDYQRDIGSTHNFLRGLLQKLYSTYVKCNVIGISHITTVDRSRGGSDSPSRDPNNPTPRSELKGYPSTIGRSIAPEIGSFFNNCFKAEESGTGTNVRREIYTTPSDEIVVKAANTAALAPRYPVQTALAEIFAALRGEPEPRELIDALRPKQVASAPTPAANGTRPLTRAAAPTAPAASGPRPAVIQAR